MRHPEVPHPLESLNDRLGDRISSVFGSMTTFGILVGWQLGWMLLATVGVGWFGSDRYPFAFLLFLSNLIQLWALPVLGNTQNRADTKRSLKADADHQALTYLATRLDEVAASVVELRAQRAASSADNEPNP
ncbi:DUF1003 domain-containing protein [Streptomyces noursei]|uniref:DUF1003 domain-containing protein n=1 Tax=Streptomyces noursei TaxID=1971 RepID=UPI00167456AE|nr:DUF1003 domain-containing protein [Streptomyces noursei]MCZ1013932.1 DUF1003 domain-containing protein [Streptomyces noursei]GGX40786.1 hypothetical protein GCM10010341_73430 [Streptomyces noursei]